MAQTNSTQSAKICPNLHFRGRGGPDQLNPKCQDLSRSAFLGWGVGGCGGAGGGGPDQLNPKCQDLSKSAFSGGGGEVVVQTNSTQSAKICLNLHLGGGDGVGGGPDQLNPKCQDLHFQGGGVAQTNSTQSAKICQNLHGGGGGPDQLNPNCQDLSRSAFLGWGVGGCGVLVVVVQTNSTQSAKICPNLHFQGWEVVVQTNFNPKCQDLPKSAFFWGGRGWWWSRPTQSKVPRSAFSGGGVVAQTNSTQSAKICQNLHGGGGGPDQLNPNCQDLSRSAFLGWGVGGLWGAGGGGPDQLNPKCQDLSKSAFSGGGGGGGPDQLNPKCQDLPKSAFWGGGWGLVVVQTNSIQSAKICILRGGGGPDQLNPKCQDLSKSTWGGGGGPDQLNPNCQDLSRSAFLGWGVGGCGVLVVVVQTNSTQSAKICPNLHFQGGEVVVQTNSTQSAKICLNLHFWGGDGVGGGPDQLNPKCQDLHFQGGGVVAPDQLNPKCQDLSKSTWGGGGVSRPTQPKLPRSVQICIFGVGCGGLWGAGGGGPDQLNPKCQDLSKSAFSGGGEVVVQTNSTQSAKICLNLHFRGGDGGVVVVQTNSIQSAKICIFRGGGGPDQLNPKCQDLSKSAFSGGREGLVVQTNIPEILEWGHSRNFEPKILATGMCSASQIASHILRMWRLMNRFDFFASTFFDSNVKTLS